MSAVEWPEIETPIPRGVEWRGEAARTRRVGMFFWQGAARPQARMRREAKARKLCDACVVRQPCREFARENREYGFWGGENEEERYLAGYPVTAAIGVRVRLAREDAAG
jgi:WhiB family redox-sensing transcriptional regulator